MLLFNRSCRTHLLHAAAFYQVLLAIHPTVHLNPAKVREYMYIIAFKYSTHMTAAVLADALLKYAVNLATNSTCHHLVINISSTDAAIYRWRKNLFERWVFDIEWYSLTLLEWQLREDILLEATNHDLVREKLLQFFQIACATVWQNIHCQNSSESYSFAK